MPFFGVPIRNGLPIGLGSVAGFGVQQFDPSQLFVGGTAGAWYDPSDLSTMFTTDAGTTPVAMPGQGAAVPVGLMLDKSQNGVGTNGAYRYNLLTYTEQFNNAAWVKDGSTAANTTATTDPLGGNTADVLTATLALYAYTYQPTPVSTITATFSCYVKAATASVFWLYYESGVLSGVAYFGTDLTTQVVAGSSQTPSNLTITSVGNGWFRISAQWSTVAGSRNFGVGISDAKGSQAITIGRAGYIWGAQVASAAAPTAYQRIDANWYSAVPGNHAISFNNTTARPELRARVNLLTYSEEFDNAAWTLSANISAFGSGSVVNATTAPNNTTTADLLTENLNTGERNVLQLVTSSSAVIQSIYVKPNGRTWMYLQMTYTGGTVPVVGDRRVWFNCVGAGSVGTVGAQYSSPSITALPNGWYRISAIINPASTGSTGTNFVFGFTTADGTVSYTGDGTSGIYIWGADLRPANIGANVPAYQRIADANTYDTSGFPLYLLFEGAVGQRGMYTPANLNLSGTDKVAVFAGVRKLSDAAFGVVTEFSADANTNNGTFYLGYPRSASFNEPTFSSRGTTQVIALTGSNAYPSPITNVLTGIGNISGDVVQSRVNGAVYATNTADQGSGNYGTYPLYIGSRNNASSWFNGHLYSLIIAGSAVSAGNISATEQWVAGKTGIQI